MKKLLTFVSVAFLITVAASCKKDSNTKTSGTYTFTVNGNKYTQNVSADSVSTDLVAGKSFNIFAVSGVSADKSAQAIVEVITLGGSKPASGTYKVVDDVTTMKANEIGIIVQDKLSAKIQGLYSTTGADDAKVTVSNSGKLSFTMSGVAIKGSNFDNTDPNNTVITDVNGSLSGSFGE